MSPFEEIVSLKIQITPTLCLLTNPNKYTFGKFGLQLAGKCEFDMSVEYSDWIILETVGGPLFCYFRARKSQNKGHIQDR